jgi:hypothetical protein
MEACVNEALGSTASLNISNISHTRKQNKFLSGFQGTSACHSPGEPTRFEATKAA